MNTFRHPTYELTPKCLFGRPAPSVNIFSRASVSTVVANDAGLNFRTCYSYGPNYYRTFDGLEYLFPGRCKYTAFSDGARSVMVTMVDCNKYSTCRKVGHRGRFSIINYCCYAIIIAIISIIVIIIAIIIISIIIDNCTWHIMLTC